jgi:hypothetical protein
MLFSCISKERKGVDNPAKFDSKLFTKSIDIDTTNCPRFFYSRPVLDSFIDGIAIIKLWYGSNDTVVATDKYRSLLICNFPNFEKKIGDTILISGKVYVVRGDERLKGNPTILYKIIAK